MIPQKEKRRSALSGIVAALIGAVITGAVGFTFGVVNDFRKSELDFVNAQIEKLYGPLYALTQANNVTWEHFLRNHWRQSTFYFNDTNPPTIEQAKTWRHWMKTVFQPLNIQTEKTIVENSQLIIGYTIPRTFQLLIAHTEAYKAIVGDWKDGDFEACDNDMPQNTANCPQLKAIWNTATLNYPDSIVACVSEDYGTLKRRQQELNGSLLGSLFRATTQRSKTCDS
jgi:hypothetical protein